MRGLERDPSQRQPTVTAFAADVTAALAAVPPSKTGLLATIKRAVFGGER